LAKGHWQSDWLIVDPLSGHSASRPVVDSLRGSNNATLVVNPRGKAITFKKAGQNDQLAILPESRCGKLLGVHIAHDVPGFVDVQGSASKSPGLEHNRKTVDPRKRLIISGDRASRAYDYPIVIDRAGSAPSETLRDRQGGHGTVTPLRGQANAGAQVNGTAHDQPIVVNVGDGAIKPVKLGKDFRGLRPRDGRNQIDSNCQNEWQEFFWAGNYFHIAFILG
jgi:hypothetical protein